MEFEDGCGNTSTQGDASGVVSIPSQMTIVNVYTVRVVYRPR